MHITDIASICLLLVLYPIYHNSNLKFNTNAYLRVENRHNSFFFIDVISIITKNC